ncbi:MAG: NfeD family protein [Acidimicrobiales bacterium]|jgi:membrane-bound ClpP family serine protease
MWVIAGVLLGLVVLASLLGFHVGPHAHLAAGIFGVLAAAWLVVMAIDGRTAPVLWVLLGADVVVSAGLGTLAWKGLTTRGSYVDRRLVSPVGAEGLAVGDLSPGGIVRVNGENWSAVSMNGSVPAGSPVHVLRVAGVRLEVWGDDALDSSERAELDSAVADNTVSVEKAPSKNESPSEGGRS